MDGRIWASQGHRLSIWREHAVVVWEIVGAGQEALPVRCDAHDMVGIYGYLSLWKRGCRAGAWGVGTLLGVHPYYDRASSPCVALHTWVDGEPDNGEPMRLDADETRELVEAVRDICRDMLGGE